MASAFWGGFADTYGGIMDEKRQANLSAETEAKKQRMLKELEKEFGQEIIDNSLTRVEGNEEVRYNKYGTEVSRRPLSAAEIEQRDLGTRKVRADVTSAEAGAEVAGLERDNYEEDRIFNRSLQQGQLDLQRANVGIAQQRLELEKQKLSPAADQAANEIVSALYAADGTGGVNSGAGLAQAFMADLDAAVSESAKLQVIAQWRGKAAALQGQQKFERDKTLRGSGEDLNTHARFY